MNKHLFSSNLNGKIAKVISIVNKGFPSECTKCGKICFTLSLDQSAELAKVLGPGLDFADTDRICLNCMKKTDRIEFCDDQNGKPLL